MVQDFVHQVGGSFAQSCHLGAQESTDIPAFELLHSAEKARLWGILGRVRVFGDTESLECSSDIDIDNN